MYEVEETIISVLVVIVFTVNVILTSTNLLLLKHSPFHAPPTHFSTTLLLCHVLGTGVRLPPAVTQFNQLLIDAVLFKAKNRLG